MLAALVGGIAISSKWLGACHSLAHQLSSQAGLHHGEAIALMLPHQMAFSLGAAAERYARIAVALNGGATTDAEKAVDAVGALIADVGLPARLRDAGVGRELLPTLAEKAYEDLNWSTNPCPVTQEDMAHMYEQAY
jgi:alcohol dehydrogenase class IV